MTATEGLPPHFSCQSVAYDVVELIGVVLTPSDREQTKVNGNANFAKKHFEFSRIIFCLGYEERAEKADSRPFVRRRCRLQFVNAAKRDVRTVMDRTWSSLKQSGRMAWLVITVQTTYVRKHCYC